MCGALAVKYIKLILAKKKVSFQLARTIDLKAKTTPLQEQNIWIFGGAVKKGTGLVKWLCILRALHCQVKYF
jgi:hypothetical protein